MKTAIPPLGLVVMFGWTAIARSDMYEAIITREKENLYKIEHTHPTVYVKNRVMR